MPMYGGTNSPTRNDNFAEGGRMPSAGRANLAPMPRPCSLIGEERRRRCFIVVDSSGRIGARERHIPIAYSALDGMNILLPTSEGHGIFAFCLISSLSRSIILG